MSQFSQDIGRELGWRQGRMLGAALRIRIAAIFIDSPAAKEALHKIAADLEANPPTAETPEPEPQQTAA